MPPLIYPYSIQATGAHGGHIIFEGLHTAQKNFTNIDLLPLSVHLSLCVSLQAKSDYFKLIFAALILVVLRLWDAIYVSLGYLPNYDTAIRPSGWIVVLVFLAVRLGSAVTSNLYPEMVTPQFAANIMRTPQ